MDWEKCLPFAEFAYNNSYQASLGKAPFEVLYGRKYRTPLNWSETGERQLFGPDMIQEAEEQVRIIREKLKIAQSRQKSHYDRKHKAMTFEVGLPSGDSFKGNPSIRYQRQIGSSLHWNLSHSCQARRSCLPTGTTPASFQSS